MIKEKLKDNNFKPLFRFLLLFVVFILGLALTVMIPHFAKPDEPLHFKKAVEVAHGKFFCFQKKEYYSQYDFNYLYDTAGRYNLTGNPHTLPLSLYKVPIFENKKINLKEQAHYCHFPPFAYIFLAVGIKLGMFFSFHPLITFYSGRLLNFLILFAIISLILLKEKKYFWLFFIPLSLPQTLHQLGAYSYDGVTIIAAFLSFYYYLQKFSKKNFILLILFITIAIISKNFLYITMTILPIAYYFKNSQFKNKLVLPILWGMVLFFAYYVISIFQNLTKKSVYESPISSFIQLKVIVDNPLYFIEVFLNTLKEKQFFYINSLIGNLEWLGFSLDYVIYFLYFFLIIKIIVDLSKADIIKSGNLREFLILTLLNLLQIFIIFFFMYLTWTNAGSTQIEGVQGRYFLPILPLFIYAIAGFLTKLFKKEFIYLITFVFITFIVTQNIYDRHFNYSKSINYNSNFNKKNNYLTFDKNNKNLSQNIQVKQDKKLAAFLLYAEAKNNKKDTQEKINNPPIYLIIQDKQCAKNLRKVIIPAQNLKQGENLIFFKPLKTKDVDAICLTIKTPAESFEEKIYFYQLASKDNAENPSYFQPQYLW